ncbi:probable LRR receptor-like serine/threonine-protein kinase At1g67720 isoform X1 [Dendrobium catenatum]|uniref:probable LRR receptor-like serine/threonine-protein kinase At1g67720 isoform X1 n=1 Tax=Dendrobium catenatum TaxID=906689 RepID=UPI0009F44D88|nr:probable LRR receptor-like serine/threonine-protein kinase At1g67720 isoform X1 [Dendrobium catenatum]
MGFLYSMLAFLIVLIPTSVAQIEEFVSIDCASKSNYSDSKTGLVWVSDSTFIRLGSVAEVKSENEISPQYKFYRYFPADNKKYCYTFNTTARRRYLVRATFLYGDSYPGSSYPMFQLYLDTTLWATITVNDGSRVYVEEMIIRAQSTSFQVCLCCASTGYPFISTLELRPLNLSMYFTSYEESFFLKVAARINFGSLSADPIRYPDDPYDRIWESDLDKRQNYLVGMAPGTVNVSTSKNVMANSREFPPVKVMQTAVVGTRGSLSYRLDLEGFPGNARAYAYLAEIEDLGKNETRKFIMKQPNVPGYDNVIVNIAENAHGSYALYEPSYMNVSLDFVLSFLFSKTRDSTRGPLLNAIEISKYVQIIPKTDVQDVAVLNAFCSLASIGDWRYDNGDPCIPAAWDWVNCSSAMPLRITKIALSNKNLKGFIPSEIKQIDQLEELWLDGNVLNGPIPDMSNLMILKILHLENNRLNGQLPSYFGELPNLQELYIQNNNFTGEIPHALLTKKFLFKYDGNPGLNLPRRRKNELAIVLATTIGAFATFVVLLVLGCFWLLRARQRKPEKSDNREKNNSLRIMSRTSTPYPLVGSTSLAIDEGLDVAYCITFSAIKEATGGFSKKIGEGSYGPVYYGKMEGKEIAVKVSADLSSHGAQQFINEVTLLSRIHHKSLVSFIGYCQEESNKILVYEYVHNGSLRDHIHDSVKKTNLDWLSRLLIAEDAAKGLTYLHNGCNPAIIHRDVKTSNILLDINMRAKVSDFGLSKQATDNSFTHISSVARGTVGYVDPEYYASQQLTDKSDVYSFGVVLLELISGKKPISVQDYGVDWNIVHWARSLISEGDITSLVDPCLVGTFKIESLWRIAEIAILSVQIHGTSRPKMQEVELAIHDAINIEMGSKDKTNHASSTASSDHVRFSSMPFDFMSSNFQNNINFPSLR